MHYICVNKQTLPCISRRNIFPSRYARAAGRGLWEDGKFEPLLPQVYRRVAYHGKSNKTFRKTHLRLAEGGGNPESRCPWEKVNTFDRARQPRPLCDHIVPDLKTLYSHDCPDRQNKVWVCVCVCIKL
jgi:hypothetical protein